MSRTALRNIAIAIILVFVITVIVYPYIFGTDPQPDVNTPAAVEQP